MNGEVVKFKYPEAVADHYRYREAVDNHNALRYYGGTRIGLENTQVTTWWPIQVSNFFIACNEVNAYLAMKYFFKRDDSLIVF